MAQEWVLWGVVAWVGAVMGSFLTLATYRLPRDEPIGMTRSRCPACQTTLAVRDLVPMLSWVMSRGKCRHCKTRISARYPLTELACAVGSLAAAYQFGFTLQALAVAGLWWSVVAIVVTDLEHTIILDEVQLAVILFGVLYHYALGTSAADVSIAALTAFGIGLALRYGYLWIRRKDGLGLGDVKFLFGAGIWLASQLALVPFLFYAGIMGVVFGSLWRVSGRGAVFPFGPALAFSLLICVVWPQASAQFWQLFGLR